MNLALPIISFERFPNYIYLTNYLIYFSFRKLKLDQLLMLSIMGCFLCYKKSLRRFNI